VPTKITVQSGAQRHHELTRRPQAGALLTVILFGSRLERREDGLPRMGALGGRDGGRPGTAGARGSASAAACGVRLFDLAQPCMPAGTIAE
jgi:hypothetical protein